VVSRRLLTAEARFEPRSGHVGFMKYAFEMVSGAMIYMPSFIKIGSSIQTFKGGIHRHMDSMEIAYAYFH
jgi:hypothetical protein